MTGAQAFGTGRTWPGHAPLRGARYRRRARPGCGPAASRTEAFRRRSVTRGVAAHSADPTKGRSAIRAMMAVVAALEERMIPLANRESPFTGLRAAGEHQRHPRRCSPPETSSRTGAKSSATAAWSRARPLNKS
jgi:acetylornithine deacetylase